MNQELKTIKKKYGEHFMHFCRELFPTILDNEGRLLEILDANFGMPKYLYEDIKNKNEVSSFKDFIYSQYYNDYKLKETTKTPFELMDEAGYTLYECHNNDEIMQFKKYYAEGEKLCTFKEHRLNYCYVFFAVKKSVNKIKRDDFKNPQREDDYGTSVISIQFSRGDVNTLSIKNRYNHTVNNPDATFHNNLENIIPGLTNSFEKTYHLNINQHEQDYLELEYEKADDGKYYKFNMEENGIYYCPDNIIIDHGKVIKDYMDKEKYILMDYFILNLQKNSIANFQGKSVNIYDKSIEDSFKSVNIYDKSIEDSFIYDLQNFDKINVINNNDKTRTIELIKANEEKVYITLDKYNNIIEYINNNIEKIDDYFLYMNEKLEKLTLENLTTIADCFLSGNKKLIDLKLPSVIEIADHFLFQNESLRTLSLPNVEKIDNKFLYKNTKLEYLYIPKVEIIGSEFMYHNKNLTNLSLPQLNFVDASFLELNSILSLLYAPNLVSVGRDFLANNNGLKVIDFPKLVRLENHSLAFNRVLRKINLPSLKIIGDFCLKYTEATEIELPSVKKIGTAFLDGNVVLNYLYAPNLKNVGNLFLSSNEELRYLSLPSLEQIGEQFLFSNNNLSHIYMPNLKEADDEFYSRFGHFLELDNSIQYKLKK